MFNLIKFNVGKFNTNSNLEMSTAAVEAIGKTRADSNIIARGQSTVDSISETVAASVRKRIVSDRLAMDIISQSNGMFVRKITFLPLPSNSFSDAEAELGIFGYEEISLPRLVIRPGDELIIDTEHLTVTLNGQNVIDYLDEGDFFDLKQGLNTLIYEDAVSRRKLSVTIWHKNRWL